MDSLQFNVTTVIFTVTHNFHIIPDYVYIKNSVLQKFNSLSEI